MISNGFFKFFEGQIFRWENQAASLRCSSFLFDSAAEGLARADRLLAENPGIPNADVLARKRVNYAALDLLNRRKFDGAVSALDQLVSAPADPSQPRSWAQV